MMTNLTVTAYCICHLCCGKVDGITAAGGRARVGITAAANHLPFRTIVDIPGLGARVIQDRMNRRYTGEIDVLMASHREALAWGRQRKVRVWLDLPRTVQQSQRKPNRRH